MVSKVTVGPGAVPLASKDKPDKPAKASEAEDKASGARDVSLKFTEVPESEGKPIGLKKKKIENVTEDVKNPVRLKEMKVRLENDKKTTPIRRVIACLIIAAVILIIALPWIAPTLFGESLFAFQIIAVVLGVSLTPVSLIIAWRLGFGGTPHQVRVGNISTKLDNDSKLEIYMKEVASLVKGKYQLEKPKDKKKKYDADKHYKEAMLALCADPALYEFLRDPKNENRKKVEESSKELSIQRRRKEELELRGGTKVELDEIDKELKIWTKSLSSNEKTLQDEEEAILKKHGFVLLKT
jgi:hypothetical protein